MTTPADEWIAPATLDEARARLATTKRRQKALESQLQGLTGVAARHGRRGVVQRAQQAQQEIIALNAWLRQHRDQAQAITALELLRACVNVLTDLNPPDPRVQYLIRQTEDWLRSQPPQSDA